MHWSNFIPLAVFAWLARASGAGATDSSWALSFLTGAFTALIQMAYLKYKKINFDYIALGANAFLIYGAVGFLLFKPLLTVYDFFEESVIFLFILIVGIIATFLRPSRFIQLPTHYKQHTIKGSLCLLALVTIVFLWSYHFQTAGILISTVFPFLALLSGREFIRNYFTRKLDIF